MLSSRRVFGEAPQRGVPAFNGKHLNAVIPRGNGLNTAMGFHPGERGLKVNVIMHAVPMAIGMEIRGRCVREQVQRAACMIPFTNPDQNGHARRSGHREVAWEVAWLRCRSLLEYSRCCICPFGPLAC